MNSIVQKLLVAVTLVIASGCATHPVASYQVSPEITTALQDMHVGGVDVEMVPVTEHFDSSCKGSAGKIGLPGDMQFEDYIQFALISELQKAGIYDHQNPTVKLALAVEEVAFAVFHGHDLSMWDIELRFKSSNGQSLYVNHHHLFDAGVYGKADCKKFADTFMPAVRATLFKMANSPDLKSLLTP